MLPTIKLQWSKNKKIPASLSFNRKKIPCNQQSNFIEDPDQTKLMMNHCGNNIFTKSIQTRIKHWWSKERQSCKSWELRKSKKQIKIWENKSLLKIIHFCCCSNKPWLFLFLDIIGYLINPMNLNFQKFNWSLFFLSLFHNGQDLLSWPMFSRCYWTLSIVIIFGYIIRQMLQILASSSSAMQPICLVWPLTLSCGSSFYKWISG